MSEDAEILKAEDLPQVIPLFPLDGALVLPHASRPFNIFEPRYLNMLDDVMAAERIIGMVQTAPGGSADRPRLAVPPRRLMICRPGQTSPIRLSGCADVD